MEFSQGLPGTKYDFRLYYSNSSIVDWLMWTTSITTAPDPPSNLSIEGIEGKIALLRYTTYLHYLHKKMYDPKGHLISEGNFGVYKSPKKRNNVFEGFQKIKALYYIR